MSTPISQEADDLIIASEVGSRAQYEKKYRRPEWPGGKSGVTIGLGYDLGFADRAKIDRDWSGHLPAEMIAAMVPCLGVTGEAAETLLPRVRNLIDVSWDAAAFVYENHDIPEWTDRVCNAIPGAEKLHPHCLGSLTSVAYNRGASFKNQGDRYREMRAVRSHIMAGELSLVDDEIRAMKRLWGSDQRGLLIRRDKEADLWNKGLVAAAAGNSIPAAKSKPNQVPAPLERVEDKTSATGKGVGSSMATGATVSAAQGLGYGPYIVGGLIVAGVVITAGVIAYHEYQRRQPTLARAKG